MSNFKPKFNHFRYFKIFYKKNCLKFKTFLLHSAWSHFLFEVNIYIFLLQPCCRDTRTCGDQRGSRTGWSASHQREYSVRGIHHDQVRFINTSFNGTVEVISVTYTCKEACPIHVYSMFKKFQFFNYLKFINSY